MTHVVEHWPDWIDQREIRPSPKLEKRLQGFTTSNRAAARLAAVQCLYGMTFFDDERAEDLLNAWREEHRDRPMLTIEDDGLKPQKAQSAILLAVVMGVSLERSAIIDLLQAALPPQKPLAKLELILQCILLAGAYEMLRSDSVPQAVVINEYLNIAHLYYGQETVSLVNGVLDSVGKAVRS